ncbi:MAG: putative aminopeptidase [Candidatus Binatia bacterium]|jgi:predicted aminopeptidase
MEARVNRSWLFALIVVLMALGSGCKTAGYYRQAARGHFRILADRQSIDETIEASVVEPDVSRKLSLILELRKFAEKELGLKPGKHYLDYVELDRRFVVWNVSASPEFSMDSIGWWYPFLGTLTYRGYFDESRARAFGARQKQDGYDVFVGGVEAYSTLGWFNDPVLSSFIGRRDDALAELIFHELAHQKIFVRGDTDFNEAYATAVAQEGLRRWLIARGEPDAIERRRVAFERETQFVSLVITARDRLEALYDSIDEEEMDEAAEEQARARKSAIVEQLRADYRTVRDGQWGGYDGYDRWIALPINNAQLNTIDTYYRRVPAFREMLRGAHGDLEAFYRDVKRLKRMKKKERTAELERLLR